MQRTKLKDRVLPDYTKGEEIFNMVSHIVGAIFGITALILCVVFSALSGNPYSIVSSAIYGITIVVLYTMSSIYHGISPKRFSKKVFQVLDHCSIFLLIAGSYTPFCLVMFREYNPVLGWSIFGIIWFMALIGVILNSIDIKRYNKFSMICYLGMGWCVIFTVNLLPKLLGMPGVILLASGGIAYSIGAVLYGLGKKKRYMHSIFHLFILLGSILQFFSILLYVII